MGRFARRRLLTAFPLLGGLLSFGRKGRAQQTDNTFTDWVRTLYIGALAVREVAEAGAGADLTDQDIQSLFTPDVQALRDAVKDRTLPPSEPDGPILHILFGWGTLPKRKIEIRSVTADGDHKAKVDLAINGNPRQLILTSKFNDTGKAWQIDDIDYGEGGPDRTLRSRLERMKDWPKRAP
jgi:hypothetical protein